MLGIDRSTWSRDLLASVVVFLVALPLCLGIAIASGVPPATGLITGIVGGLIVGTFSGAPLQVSGPAAGLAVLVYEIVTAHGLAALGPIVMLGGLIQLAAGLLRVGQLFRAISPPVIYGMLAGIGVLIFAAQFHVMVDDAPRESGWMNLLQIPVAISKALTPGTQHQTAAIIALVTVAVLLAWDRVAPSKLRWIPGALLAVIAGTAAAFAMGASIRYVELPDSLFGSIQWLSPAAIASLAEPSLLLAAVTVAFVASAETLLSAQAVDRMHDGPRTKYDRELAAQGIGNTLCGILGSLPMTGVIVRSSANVNAGAKTRLSTILHGTWLCVLVLAVPGLLRLVPTASLAAVLVLTGYKLVNVQNVKRLFTFGTMPLVIYGATLLTIVARDLLTGILVGLALSLLQTLWRLSHLDVRVQRDESTEVHVHLSGAATFVRLPRLLASLEALPPGTSTIHVHVHDVAYVDDAVLEMLAGWIKQRQMQGVHVQMEWDRVINLYRPRHLTEAHRIRKLIDGGAAAH